MKALILSLAAVFTLGACETPTEVNVNREPPATTHDVILVPQPQPEYVYPPQTYHNRVLIQRETREYNKRHPKVKLMVKGHFEDQED